MRSQRLHGGVGISREGSNGQAVFSASFFGDIMGNVRMSLAFTPTHRYEGELLLLV